MTRWQVMPELMNVELRDSGPGEVLVKIGGSRAEALD